MSADERYFKISSFCSAGGCVGVALDRDTVSVTSTRVADSPVLSIATNGWGAFVSAVAQANPGAAERA